MKKTIFLITFILHISCFAQLDRSIEPKPAPGFNMNIPKLERAVLDNGLRILVVEHNELPVVQITLLVRSGSDSDPTNKIGTANLTADLLDEGTKSRSALQIEEELDFIGAKLSTYANYDASIGNLLTLKEHLDKAVEVLSDIFLNPTFPQNEFERLKSELLTDLIAQKARADIIATNIFNNKLYGMDHPYGINSDGNEFTVKNINLTDIKEFYNKNYLPNNASIIFVGNITKNEAFAITKKYFAKWKKRKFQQNKLLIKSSSNDINIYLVHKENAPQSQIRIGNVGIERNNPDFYAVNILNQIIGASNGRLFLNLRESKGYTYGAYANFSMRKFPGPFLAFSGVKTEVTDSALIEFFYEFNRIRDELVPLEEFEMYRTAVIQRLPRIMETPSQIASQLMAIELFSLPDDFFHNLINKYKEVTPESIQKVARKYINPQNATIVIVGDVNVIKPKIQNLKLGKILLCDENGQIINEDEK